MAHQKREALIVGKRLVKNLCAAGIDVKQAYLFGSFAKNKADEDSDIDVVIVSKSFSNNRLINARRLAPFEWETDPRLEVIAYRPEWFRDEDPLVWELKTTGISLI